jgi:hypothetical protein
VAPDQGNVIPELPAIEFDEAAPVPRFLLAHGVEYGRRRGKIFPQTLGVVGIGALIVFLERDGEGENLALRESVEFPHMASEYEKPWLKSFGKLRNLRAETACINAIFEEEFERIEPEDWR